MTSSVIEPPYEVYFTYGPHDQRIKSVLKLNGVTQQTKYFSGGYEKEVSGSVTKHIHYISGAYGLVAVLTKVGQTTTIYYTETDHLGSITGLMNSSGTYLEQFSYDAWGRRRNPTNWTYNNVPQPVLLERGYTGHEHLDKLGLINMNGRMYDPVLGRFLGVDPVIQTVSNSQSLNGYSYCLNNPLKYIDPSGYSSRTFEYERNYYANERGTEFFNNYVDWWGDFVNATSHKTINYYALGQLYQKARQGGYERNFYYFQTDLSKQINIPLSFNSQSAFTWHTWESSHWIEGRSAVICETKIIHSVTLDPSGQGGKGFGIANDIIWGVGVVNGLVGFDAAINSNHVYRYAQRVVSAAELTATNQAKALKVLNASKSIGNILGVASGLVIAGDVLYNSEIKASHGINAFMTGIAFTGWGAPVAGIWFVADFGTGLFTGKSISDRIDSGIGAPLVDWDW